MSNISVLEEKLTASGWWNNAFKQLFTSEKYASMQSFLYKEYASHKIYPSASNVFKSMFLTPYDKLKVVIIGQDPYHTPLSANGLAFAVNPGSMRPPSLRNIFKELEMDLGEPVPLSGCSLEGWAQQGVLLLNTVLTVREAEPNSHSNKGWEEITGEIIRIISTEKTHVVFMLWGEHAQKQEKNIKNIRQQIILKAGHPSPLSARLFMGCKHFTKANEQLKRFGKDEINWLKINNLEEPAYAEFIGQSSRRSFTG
jgi:uracil-DNA glycosylase